MNAFKQIIKPKGRHISFDLPEEFERNSEVEIIVLSSEKQTEENKNVDLRSLRGALAHLSEKEKSEIDNFFINIRNEWERDIL